MGGHPPTPPLTIRVLVLDDLVSRDSRAADHDRGEGLPRRAAAPRRVPRAATSGREVCRVAAAAAERGRVGLREELCEATVVDALRGRLKRHPWLREDVSENGIVGHPVVTQLLEVVERAAAKDEVDALLVADEAVRTNCAGAGVWVCVERGWCGCDSLYFALS